MEHRTMTKTALKLAAIALFALAAIFMFGFKSTPATGASPAPYDDPAATYKAKCAMCHTPAATKFYDPAKPDAEQVDAIMNGKKAEKPPNMPGFGAKGMTEDEAKALAAYMKTLRAS
jgi:mono/diheme cytochrome c family protein